MVGDDAFTNTLSLTGDGTVTYTSSNTEVATIGSDGVVTVGKAGTATITATVTDGTGYHYATTTAAYTLTVSLPANPTEEQYVSSDTYWTFDTDVATEYTAKAITYKRDGLYMRGNSSNSRHFIIGQANSGEEVAITLGGINYNVKNVAITDAGIDGPTGDTPKAGSTTGKGVPMLAFNASVPGTVYAVVSPVENGSGTGRVYFGDGSGTPTNVTASQKTLSSASEKYTLEYTATTAGSFFIGTTVPSKIYGVRFVPSTLYDVTVNVSSGGTAVADAVSVTAGATVTVTTTPADGYQVGTVTVKDGSNASVSVTKVTESTSYTFAMPSSAATISVTFTKTENVTVSETTSWTFNDFNDITYTSITNLGNGLYLRSASADYPETIGSQSDCTSWTFADGTTVSGISKCLSLAALRPGNGTPSTYMPGEAVDYQYGTLAFKTAVAGKLYVVMSNESGNYRIYNYNGSELKQLKNEAVGTSATEYSTEVEAGTVYIAGIVAGAKVYAVHFVPKHTVTKTVAVEDTGTFTVKNGDTEIASGDKLLPGETLTIEVTPAAGYQLETLTANSEAITKTEGVYSFTMPDADITIVATFMAVPTYTVSKGTMTNGDITLSSTSATAGTEVTITVTPSDGYRLKSGTLKATYNDGTEEKTLDIIDYTFTMPANAVTVSAEFEKKPVVYGTYDFKAFAADNITFTNGVTDAQAVPELANGVMTGNFTLDAGTGTVNGAMTLNDAFSLTDMNKFKVRKNSNANYVGLLAYESSSGSALTLNSLKEGDWFTMDVSGTVYFKNANANVKKFGSSTTIAADEALESGVKYIVSDATTVDLYNKDSGNAYIYTVTISKDEAVSDPAISDLVDGLVTVTPGISTASGTLKTYYTIDGSEPSATNGTEYTEAVAIDQTRIVKAVTINTTTNVKSNEVTKKVTVDGATPATTWDFKTDEKLAPLTIGSAMGVTGYYYTTSDQNNTNFLTLTNSAIHSKMSWLSGGEDSPTFTNVTGTGLKDSKYRAFTINDLAVGDKIYITYETTDNKKLAVSKHTSHGDGVKIDGTAVADGSLTEFESGAEIAVSSLDELTTTAGDKWNYVMFKATSDKIAIQKIEINPVFYALTVGTADNGSIAVTVNGNEATKATAGTVVTLGVTPETGYEVDAVTVKYDDDKTVEVTTVADNSEYSFTMPDNAVNVAVTFKQIVEKTVGTTTNWTFGDLTAGTSYKAVTAVNDEYYLRGATATNRNFTVTASDTQTLTFADGTSVEATNYLAGNGKLVTKVDTDNDVALTAANTAGDATNAGTPTFAFNATKAGTVYAKISSKTAGKLLRIYFADGESIVNTGSKFKPSTTDITEISYTSMKPGTFFICGAEDAFNIYAVRFVPTDEAMKYTLKVGTVENGTITAKVDETTTAEGETVEVLPGATVTLAAVPDAGYQFSGWKDGNDADLGTVPQSLETVVTMPITELTVKASFTAQPSSPTVITTDKTWTFDDCPAEVKLSGSTVYESEGLYISGHAATNYATVKTLTEAQTFSMGGDGNVTVNSYLVSQGSQDGDLAASRSVSSYTRDAVSFQTGIPGTLYIALAHTGYAEGRMVNVYVNGVKNQIASTGTDATVITQEIASAGNIFVSTSAGAFNLYAMRFVPATVYTLTTKVEPEGKGTIIVKSGDTEIIGSDIVEGTVLTLTAVPASGYELKEWQDGNGTKLTANDDGTLTVTMTADQTVNAVLEKGGQVYDFAGAVTDGDVALTYTNKSAGTRFVVKNDGNPGRYDFSYITNEVFGSNNISLVDPSDSWTLTKEKGGLLTTKSDRFLAIHGLEEGDVVRIVYEGGTMKYTTAIAEDGSAVEVNTVDMLGKTIGALETIGSQAKLTVTGISNTNNFLVFIPSSNDCVIKQIYINKEELFADVVSQPLVEFAQVDLSNDRSDYKVYFEEGTTVHYQLNSLSEQALATGATTIPVTETGTLKVWATKGNATSTVLETIVYAPTPAVTDGNYDFHTITTSLPIEVPVTLNTEAVVKSYTVDGGTVAVYQPTDLTKRSFGECLALSEPKGALAFAATKNGLHLKSGGDEVYFAIQSVKKDDVITFETAGDVTYLLNVDKEYIDTDSLKTGVAYTVLKDGDLLVKWVSRKADGTNKDAYLRKITLASQVGKTDPVAYDLMGISDAGGTLETSEETVQLAIKTWNSTRNEYQDATGSFLNVTTLDNRVAVQSGDGSILPLSGAFRFTKRFAIQNLGKGDEVIIRYIGGGSIVNITPATAVGSDIAVGDTVKAGQKITVTQAVSPTNYLAFNPTGTVVITGIFINKAEVEKVTKPTLALRDNSILNVVRIRPGQSTMGNGVTVRYTADGTTPTATTGTVSTATTTDVTLNESGVVKAITVSSTGLVSEVSTYEVTLPEAENSDPVAYDVQDIVETEGELEFGTTGLIVYNKEYNGTDGVWETKRRSDFMPVENMDNKVSVRAGASSIIFDKGNVRLTRSLAIHNLGVGDEIIIRYEGTGSLVSAGAEEGDEFTVSGTAATPGMAIPSDAVIKVTKAKYADNYVVVTPASSGTVYLKNIYINTSAPETLHVPSVTLKDVDGENAIYTVAYDEGATLHYLMPSATEAEEGDTSGAYDLTITEGGKLSVWTTKGDMVSETLTTTVYTPTPAPSEDGNYDFSEASDELKSDIEVTLDDSKSVTVDGVTLYMPGILTAATFDNQFAFSETNVANKVRIRTNRQLTFAQGVNMDMAILNLQRGDIVAIDYSGGTITFAGSDIVTTDQGSLNAAAHRAVTADETMVSGENYVVTAEGDLLLHLNLASAINIAKMTVTTVAQPSEPKALDFVTAMENEEALEAGSAVTVYFNGQDASGKFIKVDNDSEVLPSNGKISTQSGRGSLTASGLKLDRNRFAIHNLAVGDTIKIRFYGGALTYAGHETKGDQISVKTTGTVLTPGEELQSGVVIKVDKVDYLNNYVVLQMDASCTVSGIFINRPEIEKVWAPTLRDRGKGLVQITPGRSSMDREVFTCYTTDGTEPSMTNGVSGVMSGTFDLELLELYETDVTVKVVSFSPDGTMSKVTEMVVHVDGIITGIDGVPTVNGKPVAIYDLRGRKVQTMTKGQIYVINGKKYLYK